MEINNIYSGFELKSIKRINDLDSNLYEFKHKQSGGTLLYLDSDDANKCFTIGFKTLPEDSTGVCHIIEHSVLCGSKKYPVKEPFVNLLKGSMATFLNAFTSSDWTMYPVASQNDKDFNNLMSVYLDAVFAPLCMVDEKPFLQEGWHIEMNSKDDMPSYKGIVYNEMKGSMSGVERQLEQHLESVFYKDSCYEFNSGGDPDVIPTLTYEYYKKFYHKHYHPNNAVIFLYGTMDLEEKLAFIDKEYLSLFHDDGKKIEVKMPTPRIIKDSVFNYPVATKEELEKNVYFSLAFALDRADNIRDVMGFELLTQALMETNASPLKKALLDLNLGADITSHVNNSTVLPAFVVSLHKSELDKKEEFYNAVISEFNKIVLNGVDKDTMLGVINRSEFENKEMDSGTMPKGLLFAFSIMNAFNYDFPYEDALEASQYFEFFKKELDNGYFESLIKKYILDSTHLALVTLVPSDTMQAEKEAIMNEKMASLKANMTDSEIDNYVRITEELIAYQNRVDTPEEVSKLPKLMLEDIKTDVYELQTEIKDEDGNTFIYHNFNTNKIGYLRIYFDLNVLDINELPYLSLLNNLFCKLDTEKYSALEIQNYIRKNLGSVSFTSASTSKAKEDYTLKEIVTLSALKENITYMSTIVNEIINHTIFDEEKVKTIILQIKNRLKNSIISNGMAAASTLARSTLSKEGVINSKMSSVEMYNFVCQLLEDFDIKKLEEKFTSIIKRVFSNTNYIASLSGDSDVTSLLKEEITKFELSDIKPISILNVLISDNIGDGIVIPSGVNNNIMAINLKDLGEEIDGKLYVAQQIINFDYLWPEIRVKGGAYGANFQLSSSLDVLFSSYCDPNVSNTYNVYEETANYLESLDVNEDEFNSYLIGTMAKFDAPVSNFVKILIADNNIFRDNTKERRELIKKQALSATLDDIKAYSKLFKKISQLAKLFTVGNETKIKEYSRLEKIENLK